MPRIVLQTMLYGTPKEGNRTNLNPAGLFFAHEGGFSFYPFWLEKLALG
jgi:hypothetical protein